MVVLKSYQLVFPRTRRRAQQRFRERQRGRLAESQERAQALRASITQLRIEHELLLTRNCMLEKFKSVRQAEEREADVLAQRRLEAPPGDGDQPAVSQVTRFMQGDSPCTLIRP